MASIIQAPYKNGKKDGKQFSYYRYVSGQLSSESNYKNGGREGKQIFYNHDGSIDEEINYINNQRSY